MTASVNQVFGFFGAGSGEYGFAAAPPDSMIHNMTYQESVALIKDLMGATSKDDLQSKMGANVEKVDATFFMVVNDVAARLHAQGKSGAAQHLTQIGDALARLRFMI